MSSGPNPSLSTPTPSLDSLGPLSWRLLLLRNTRPTSRLETGAQHISWSQGRSISCSPSRRPCLAARAFFLSSLSTSFSDVVPYSGTECNFYLLSFTSIPPDSVLDTPQQNSYTEWFMHTLSNKVECMCFGACIPQSWWNFSYNQACHVYNHIPQMWLNWRTFYKVLEEEKPHIEHLWVFGYGVYVYIPQAVRKDKLCPKSELITYIGIYKGTSRIMLSHHWGSVLLVAYWQYVYIFS